MQKLLNMKIKIIKSEAEYNLVCERIYELIHSQDDCIEPESEKAEELELLSLLAEDYEKRMNYKLGKTNPIEILKIKMQEKNIKQSDLVHILGNKSTVSKILNYKRSLTVDMIKKLSLELNIPSSLLI